ncbi:piggyBac transposable element-derived protein 3-like [Anthonomus grandis grandis]|uniref:piggyBac transposable element-derived protein 3-like n=1 Tax=Anthonomus grandis grandis TaxID=2921223 RepID=UPI002165D1ED|nr:piggyBac transposable element-derived protein 3-like [Anthonomus grandis grandis]
MRNGYVTDEDSGDDDQVTMNNLPGSLLNSEAEPVFKATSHAIDDNEDNLDDSDDDVPLSSFMKYKKKCRNNDWVRQDITDTLPIWYDEVTPINNNLSPLDIFNFFF